MNALFSPGVRLLEGFSFARKFQILFLLFALPLGYALWVIAGLYQERLTQIDGELSGLRAIVVLDDALNETIVQRTLLARWKGTEVAAKATLEQRAGQLEAMLDKVDAQLKAESLEGPNRALFDELKSRSEAIRPQVLASVALPDALERYQAVLQSLQSLREQVATSSGLILDPVMDTYLMMEQITYVQPRTRELLGNFVASAHGAVISRHFTLQSRVAVRDLRRALDDSVRQLRKAREAIAGKGLPNAELDGSFSQAEEALSNYLAAVDKGMFDANPFTLEVADFISQAEQAGNQLAALQTALDERLRLRLGVFRGQAMASMSEVIGGFAVLTLLALYMLLCLNAAIRRGTAAITEAAEGLRAGDLRVSAAVHGRDDLAQIAEALNAALVQLRNSLDGVNRESQQLGGTVRQLNDQAEETLVSVEQQQGQVSQIAAAAHQLAATAQTVAESCEGAAADAQQTRQIAMQSNQRSARTGASMRELSSRLGETVTALQQLREQTQQINRVVDVIKGIAEQTNLLALNAAIEAARAGEQGRGFAVVADEVRSLSQRTQDSTQEIGDTVSSLQGVVGQAVALMETAYRQAEGDVGSVLSMGDDLSGIADAVQRVSDRLAQIATAAEQQAATADEVSGNIQQVDQAAALLLGGARSVQSVAEQLRLGSQALHDNTSRFRLG
ncbi:methyl-accepting chemotaxis protein [Pseudomonas otitidis]|uniref:methyl-accepting chemotaxis protein n=1 Tax=Metapseudomonas otitidis TaxID=319939 RepID=UPI0024475CAD|nr:methyl-accepting chemotaxis protein [Pseudomonas otitidis]MDH1106281.1 methyl-accepting chemotaxis protein [Pseudomonas otitidis]MDH1159377.1 methyl-accepting chemotaxis protein [Pseudomonas otitidis]MDH1165619.1 methyl-accepting chemotaxis protein [Pseudomonas otitidis]